MGTFIVGGAFLLVLTWAIIHAHRDMKKGKCAGCSASGSCSVSKEKSKKEDTDKTCQIKF